LPGGFFGVVLSWFISPVFSGVIACIIFFIVRLILRSKNPFQNSVRVYPALVFFCTTVFTLFMLMKGIKSDENVKDMEVPTKVGVSFAVGAGVALLAIPLYFKCKARISSGQFKAPPLAIEVAEEAAAAKYKTDVESSSTTTKASEPAVGAAAPDPSKRTVYDRVVASVTSSLNTDVHQAVEYDERTLAVHKNAERFDKDAEAMFTYLQVFSACFDALAHGANDVANAVGPFATIFLLYNGGEVGSKQDMGDHKYWILGMGGIGIGVGLLLYGSQILRAIGVKLAVITPSRGFSIELGSSTVVIIGAYYGLPLSTTHCQVGATVGVAMLEGLAGVNKWVLIKTAFGWVFTCVFVGFLAGMMTAWGAYAPVAHYPDIIFVNTTA